MENLKPKPLESGCRENPLLRIYLLIGFVATVTVGSMGFIFYLGSHMVAAHTPLTHAAMEINLEATLGHLWFEEVISGDRNESIGGVLKYIDQADLVETELQGLTKKELATFRIVQTVLIAVCLVVTVVVGAAFGRFVRGSIRNELALQAANQQLAASEQQLRATNEQLMASEQQLKAANQQLAAGEQQLRANEQELRREKDRVRSYLDVAGVMLVAIDSEQRVDLINKKGCEILGYNEDEIVGKNWFDCFLPQRLRDPVKAVFERLTAGEIEPIEYYENPVLMRDGSERLMSWHNTVLRNDEGRIVFTLSSGEDITERKQAEDALRKSEEEYRRAVEDLTEFLVRWLPDGTRTFVNDSYCRYFGISRDEAIGTGFLSLS